MPFYVTSILMGSDMNVGILLGFSFGTHENKTAYQLILEAIEQELEFSIRQVPPIHWNLHMDI